MKKQVSGTASSVAFTPLQVCLKVILIVYQVHLFELLVSRVAGSTSQSIKYPINLVLLTSCCSVFKYFKTFFISDQKIEQSLGSHSSDVSVLLSVMTHIARCVFAAISRRQTLPHIVRFCGEFHLSCHIFVTINKS